MQKIVPFLWFENQAEEAAEFYRSVFRKGKMRRTTRYGREGPGPEGEVMAAAFRVAGQDFVALNGSPGIPFSQAVSFAVNCRNQKEIDWYWERLSDGGEQQRCGWLKDRFGVSWQVVPSDLARMLGDPDPEKAGRVMKTMLPMGKLDIGELRRAYKGK